jgi:hypothetical protein
MLDVGEDSRVVQNETYKNCYTIYVSSCDDIAPMEKFMVKSMEDLGKLREEMTSKDQEE